MRIRHGDALRSKGHLEDADPLLLASSKQTDDYV